MIICKTLKEKEIKGHPKAQCTEQNGECAAPWIALVRCVTFLFFSGAIWVIFLNTNIKGKTNDDIKSRWWFFSYLDEFPWTDHDYVYVWLTVFVRFQRDSFIQTHIYRKLMHDNRIKDVYNLSNTWFEQN